MEPKYSVLLCSQDIDKCSGKIRNWLYNGIKVIWFGSESDKVKLDSDYPEFIKAFLLQTFVVTTHRNIIIIDGKESDNLLDEIGKECPHFNLAQYRIEHCRADRNIIVQASAGTGKTFVMIDRIMYLIHTMDNLRLPEICMITFTNEAAEQMCSRLQDVLMTRYNLTHQSKYLEWVEEQSQMRISTIHSFAYELIKEYGINEGFTRELSFKSLEFERKELIKSAIDSEISESNTMVSQLGVPFYKANSIINNYWSKASQLGIAYDDLVEFDWGTASDKHSEILHSRLKSIITKADKEFFEVKREHDAVTTNDVLRDLEKILVSSQEKLVEADINMKYLFIDEFQDSDMAQIRVVCTLARLHKLALFVVGDVKQSIYRFRGATDKAFYTLTNYMSDMGIPLPSRFTLINNYRTSSAVLDHLDEYFYAWNQMGFLSYDSKIIGLNNSEGSVKMVVSYSKDELNEQLVKNVSDKLDELSARIENGEIKPDSKNRVAVLVRSNKELGEAARILERAKIPVSVQRDGSFYDSDAVRDFYMVVSSFVFSDEPKYVFNYLMTPYAGQIESIDLNRLEYCDADYNNLVNYLDYFVEQTSWKKYHKMLRLKPVMSVLKKMIDETDVTGNYISMLKAKRISEGWEEKRIFADTYAKAKKYQANIEKLLEILQNQLGNDKVSLYDVYNFLKLNIATNRSENEAKADSFDNYKAALCMTVHKSKGLEFETVIIPFTNVYFGGWPTTEMLIDFEERKIGWNYKCDDKARVKYNQMKNTHYDYIKELDIQSGYAEGARLLYVAMTRTINQLICIVPDTGIKKNSWADLIRGAGIDL